MISDEARLKQEDANYAELLDNFNFFIETLTNKIGKIESLQDYIDKFKTQFDVSLEGCPDVLAAFQKVYKDLSKEAEELSGILDAKSVALEDEKSKQIDLSKKIKKAARKLEDTSDEFDRLEDA